MLATNLGAKNGKLTQQPSETAKNQPKFFLTFFD
jgi:hypothetical protein